MILTFSYGFSQIGEVKINKSEKLEKIIQIKKELNKKIQNLKIQIYNGDRNQAETIKAEYIETFSDTSAKMIYETPNYKVWVGNFFTQIEADKYLLKIRKKYKSAFIFRPEYYELEIEQENEEEINN
jgi:UDP-N-acetylmuramyl pentapeptide synthase